MRIRVHDIRALAFEEAIRAVCPLCRNGNQALQGEWHVVELDNPPEKVKAYCLAAPIRRLMQT